MLVNFQKHEGVGGITRFKAHSFLRYRQPPYKFATYFSHHTTPQNFLKIFFHKSAPCNVWEMVRKVLTSLNSVDKFWTIQKQIEPNEEDDEEGGFMTTENSNYIEERFQDCVKFVNGYMKVLTRQLNDPNNGMDKEKIKESLEHFKKWNITKTDYPWTDKEKLDVIGEVEGFVAKLQTWATSMVEQ